jgi:hypothetical protein
MKPRDDRRAPLRVHPTALALGALLCATALGEDVKISGRLTAKGKGVPGIKVIVYDSVSRTTRREGLSGDTGDYEVPSFPAQDAPLVVVYSDQNKFWSPRTIPELAGIRDDVINLELRRDGPKMTASEQRFLSEQLEAAGPLLAADAPGAEPLREALSPFLDRLTASLKDRPNPAVAARVAGMLAAYEPRPGLLLARGPGPRDRLVAYDTKENRVDSYDLVPAVAGELRLAGSLRLNVPHVRSITATAPGRLFLETGPGEPLYLVDRSIAPGPVSLDLTPEADCLITVSPEGRLAAAAGPNGILEMFEFVTEGGRPVLRQRTSVSVGPTSVVAGAFAPGGRTLAVGTLAGDLLVWDVPTGRLQLQTSVPKPFPKAVAFSDNGATLVVAAGPISTGTAEVDRFSTAGPDRWAFLDRFEVPGGVSALALSPDGSKVTVTDNRSMNAYTRDYITGQTMAITDLRGSAVFDVSGGSVFYPTANALRVAPLEFQFHTHAVGAAPGGAALPPGAHAAPTPAAPLPPRGAP